MEAAIFATLGTMIVALLSGLAVLAMRYPKTYRTVYGWIGNVMAVISVFLFGYVVGIGSGSNAVIGFVPLEKVTNAMEARDAAIPRMWVLFLIGAFLAYLIALWILSDRLHEEKKEIEDAKRKGG